MSVCPHAMTSEEGTSFCQLAEQAWRDKVLALRSQLDEALRLLSVPISEMDTAYGAECDAFLSHALTAIDKDPEDG